MDQIKHLKEKLGTARKDKQQYLDERASKIDDLELLMNTSAPDQKAIKELQSNIDTLKFKIQKENKKIEKFTDELISKNEDPALATNDSFHSGYGSFGSSTGTYWNDSKGNKLRVLNRDEKLASSTPDISMGEFLRGMVTGKARPAVKNALSEGTDSAGGFTVPSATLDAFFDKMRSKSRLIQAGARTLELSTDETTIARTIGDPTAAWHLENATIAASDLTFEGATFKARTLVSLVKASRELVMDSVNVEDALESAFTGALGSEVDRALLFGTDTAGQPKGLTSYAGVGTFSLGTGNGGPLTNYDPLLQIYRLMLDANSSPPSAFLMSPREWESLAVLKDSTGRYLDRPQALEGIPFLETTNIPVNEVVGTSNNTSRIITGNWNDLVIGFRRTLRIELLRETYAENYQFGFLAHLRVDAVPAREQSFAQVTGITP